MKKILIIFCAAILISAVSGSVFYVRNFTAPESGAETESFVVSRDAGYGDIAEKLQAQGFIKSAWAFDFVMGLKGHVTITPGGYSISKSMGVWELTRVLAADPAMHWVVIREGLRKEEIADILASSLGWTDAQKKKWLTVDTTTRPEYVEGVYFPDTYLIPKEEDPADTAKRLQAKFQEKFAPLSKDAVAQNIKWDTALKVASIVQREAAGKPDMALIAGIYWNRLLSGMPLQVDATVQYARGDRGNGWWAPLTVADKQIDSPYNTYKYKGLPPHPISNPGLDAIEAVLHPEETDCLYYIHDSARVIHCAKTYEEHKQNIAKFL